MNATQLHYGDVTFESRSGRGAVFFDTLTGWYEPPRDLTTESQHPSGDGVISGLARHGARIITISGYLSGTRVEVLDAKDRLGGQRRGVLAVHERDRGLTREATCRRTALSFDRGAATGFRLDVASGDFQVLHAFGEGDSSDGSAPGEIALNAGRATVALMVANTGDRPIQVGSHYHFAETNAALEFDRAAAHGMRLAIPAGTAVRFEPGQAREVTLVAYGGLRIVHGFRGRIGGAL